MLTVANVGDSRALLDTGAEALQVTADHRIGPDKEEYQRLKAAGVHLAQVDPFSDGPAVPGGVGVGAVRVWPGGLAMSRAIGDADCGVHILPHPHMTQVAVRGRCRLIIASDGIWDSMSSVRFLVGNLRRGDVKEAAHRCVRMGLTTPVGNLRDDCSVMVVDIIPPEEEALRPAVAKKGSGGGGLFACVCGSSGATLGGPEALSPAEVLETFDSYKRYGGIAAAEAERYAHDSARDGKTYAKAMLAAEKAEAFGTPQAVNMPVAAAGH